MSTTDRPAKKIGAIIPEPKTDIIIVDDLPPEANAMVQALYSRDPRSVRIHLEDVKRRGPEKFMAQYYVGYGDKSIGDCGTTTIFIENGSLLVPKVVQDFRLYNGQEASTRYLDMQGQDLINPCEDEHDQKIGEEILTRWMKIYNRVLNEMIPIIEQKHPFEEGQDEKEYRKAVKARAFDIARGFLPAAITTFASWHTNLRQAYAHLHEMQYHPLKEMRDVANMTLAALKEKYPSSFSHKTYPATEAYLDLCSREYTYFDLPDAPEFEASHNLDLDSLDGYRFALTGRPAKNELPAKMEKLGQLKFRFALDFGSFRDLQRHRSGICEMPLLHTHHGFNLWYLDQLPDELRSDVEREVDALALKIHSLSCDDFTRQYYVAIGFDVACEYTGGLPSIVFISELRSTQAVHPTLRVIAQKMGEYLRELIPDMTLHHDMSPLQWSVKRGKQDIIKTDGV